VLFLPFVKSLNRFRHVLGQADVILDTPHHGGGTTVNLALSTGTPVVTIRGSTARSLGSCAFYDLMGLSGCVAPDADAYVRLAVQLANDRQLNQATRDAILRNRPRMLRNDAVVDAYAQAFRQLAEEEGA